MDSEYLLHFFLEPIDSPVYHYVAVISLSFNFAVLVRFHLTSYNYSINHF